VKTWTAALLPAYAEEMAKDAAMEMSRKNASPFNDFYLRATQDVSDSTTELCKSKFLPQRFHVYTKKAAPLPTVGS